MIPLAVFALSGCLALSPASDQIRARDLAAALPQWSAIEADTPLLPAPIPGVQRVLHAAELHRLALRWNVADNLNLEAGRDLCFAIPVATPDPARMLAAMQDQLPEARIEILDASRQRAPSGTFEFPAAGLHAGSGGGYWNGYVRYGTGRRFAVWARVKVVVSRSRVVAAQDLKPGQTLSTTQLRLETQDAFPDAGSFVATLEAAAGRVVRRSIPADTPIRPEWLESPKEIQRGETVQVEVIQGSTHLHLEGVAQAAGAAGETIAIENPTSRRRFPARVEGKGKVVVKGTL
jgi:flagella basal body P-ring formation protein FlgA